jgi:hypothetical protein
MALTSFLAGRSSEGKAPDSIKGKVYNDEFIGKLLRNPNEYYYSGN